jgi:peroxiredoxin
MSLQDQLDKITARTRSLVQADRLAVSEQAAAELFATGIEEQILKVGSLAPEFCLSDAATGQMVRSSDLVALGPVVVKFFRGRWDPYCVTELETWRDLYPRVRERGALVVAISPQTRRQNDFAVQEIGLPFPVLSDPGCELAGRFGLAHSVPAASRRYYRSILVNIPAANAGLNYDSATEASWNLPLPALYLIGRDGRVGFGEAFADSKVRPEPADLLSLL